MALNAMMIWWLAGRWRLGNRWTSLHFSARKTKLSREPRPDSKSVLSEPFKLPSNRRRDTGRWYGTPFACCAQSFRPKSVSSPCAQYDHFIPAWPPVALSGVYTMQVDSRESSAVDARADVAYVFMSCGFERKVHETL
jgi:hypothetical protein